MSKIQPHEELFHVRDAMVQPPISRDIFLGKKYMRDIIAVQNKLHVLIVFEGELSILFHILAVKDVIIQAVLMIYAVCDNVQKLV
jgi:hypothetical protein